MVGPPPVVEPVETALLLVVPAADPVVGPQRAQLDRAAAVGVPAHVTVVHPFVPFAALGAEELGRLADVASSVPAFTLRFARTAWFGEDVVFLDPSPRQPVLDLIDAVLAAFPDFPPYGGAYHEHVPHLTIGHAAPPDRLRAAEAAVLPRLPVTQDVEALTLWAGPPLLTQEHGWRQVASFPLG